jgi:hypothetical protein
MNDGGMALHAILTYPVYGLTAPDLEPRWLAMVSGSAGEEPLGVTFAHGNDSRGATVTTGQRSTAPAPMSQSDWDWYDGGLSLLTRTDVDFRSAAGKKWRAAADAFDGDHLAHYELWDQLSWSVDGVTVSARSFTIGTSWAALTTDLASGLLWVYGQGVSPALLEFCREDGSEYGVDLAEPLHFPNSLIASRALAGLTDNA